MRWPPPAAVGRRARAGARAWPALAVLGWLWCHGGPAPRLAVPRRARSPRRSRRRPSSRTPCSARGPAPRGSVASPPLVWLGRISLRRLPVALAAVPVARRRPHRPDRVQLFGVRCAATLAVAAVSFVAVERPELRTAVLAAPPDGHAVVRARRAGRHGGRRGGRHAAAAGRRRASPVERRPGAVAGPGAGTAPESAPAPRAPGRHRSTGAGRQPGRLPRITFLGDSVSWTLGTYLPPQHELDVSVRGDPGLRHRHAAGHPLPRRAAHATTPAAPRGPARWTRAVRADDPDVAVVLLDRWELMDRRLGGRYQHVGDPGVRHVPQRPAGHRARHRRVAGRARGAADRPVHPPRRTPGRQPVSGGHRRTGRRLERAAAPAAAARHHATVARPRTGWSARTAAFTWSVDGVRIRSDGLHFTPAGVREVIAPWLLPASPPSRSTPHPHAEPPHP